MKHNKSLHTIQLASTFIVLLLLLLFSTITVSAEPIFPVANFSTDVTSGYAPFTVQFNDSSENAIGWNWDFGDGSNSTEQNPIHTYSTIGNYTVNLTVSYTNTASKIVTITVSAQPILPIANFSTDATSGHAPFTVQFNDSSENATLWNWDFDDGLYTNEQNPIHTYSTVGNYTVNLTVSNENGTNSKLAPITVLEPPVIVLPVANFSANVTDGFAPLSVHFNDNSENATGWSWDFGDGADSTDPSPEHTYSEVGNFTANLTVTNANGTDSKLAIITVSAQPILPVANFSTDVTNHAPFTVQFNDNSENATLWNWDFGDESNSTEQNPIHVYAESGNYTVNLTVSNENGTNSMTSIMAVLSEDNGSTEPIHGPSINDTGLPIANYSSNVTSGYAPFTVQFNDSSENAIGWNWDFGDGSNSTEQNPIHTYSLVGNYTVNLTASNENGTDSTTSTITVLPEKTESLNGTIEWGPSTKYDTGGPNSLVMDNASHCVETHVGGTRLFYRVGNVNFTNNTINWGSSVQFDTGGPDTISLDNSGRCIEAHVGSGSLFYRVGNVNFTNNTINWGKSLKFDTGGPDAISLDNSGHCVETHVGGTRLFYRVGNVNFSNNTINWGSSVQFDTGGPDTISLDNSGRCIEAHVGSGSLFYRVGNVNFTNNTINWGKSLKFDTGGPDTISLDNSGRCIEAHKGGERLFYRVCNVNFTNNTINWGKSLKFDTGGPDTISLDNSGHCIEAHVGSGILYYRVGKVNF